MRPTHPFTTLTALCLLAGLATAQGSDDCNIPQLITGTGTYAFDNTGATTGVDGQTCTAINSDVWWEWTADFTGTATFSTCGGTTLDTKLAVYPGSACPGVNPAFNCDDDSCGLQTAIIFQVTTGSVYLLQLGSYSTTTQGSGTFDIGPQVLCMPDDSFEQNDSCQGAVSMLDGSYVGLVMNEADDDWYSTTILAGDTLDCTIYFLDVEADVDIRLLDLAAGCPGTYLMGSASVTDNETITYTNATGLDQDVVLHVYMYAPGTLNCLNYDMDLTGGSGGVVGTPFCFGDGSDSIGGLTPCPCGNPPLVGSGEGCLNGTSLGAFITASGSPSVAADTLVLTVNQAVPSDFGIFVQNIGIRATPAPFYNGAFCLNADSHLVRHYAPPAVQPTVTDPTGMGSNAQPMTVGDYLGDSQAGVTVYYQFWGRDNAGPCGSGANFSSGLFLTWLP